ncbi:uncharacterized protein LOC128727669 [Anopheles nili]|uniref:uncharacterized protein LOC128727669 n=1 Tax=Anopheles nili TaxID=185578 RepID=UPI00237A7639|nr:uncharacterized protein LOC128727669 [Anopheles nili]
MSLDSMKQIKVQLSNIERNYRTLQSEYNWKPLSETFEKFRKQPPIQFDEKAGLTHRAERLNYIKSSQPKLAQDVKIKLKRYRSSNETRNVLIPAESFRYDYNCNKQVERAKNIIYTNAKGFTRLVDPYISTTMIDIVPHEKLRHDTVTFWNWEEREERKRAPKDTAPLQPRMVVPVFKHKLHNGFISEMQASFVKPVEIEFRLDPTITHPIVLESTDHAKPVTESSTYGGNKNCASIQKQRKYE